ncbi:MAG: hypothetical protein WDN23_11810 [Edaphobacter sp.]
MPTVSLPKILPSSRRFGPRSSSPLCQWPILTDATAASTGTTAISSDVTDNNAAFEGGVPYWGQVHQHDDNRDINYAGLANQNLLKWYLDWHPPIMHDLHESVWFLYTYSGQAPQNTLFDPILWGELPGSPTSRWAQLTKYGMPGVWTHGYVDGWSPGYVAIMSANHNGMMRMYEIMGNGGATTMHRFIPESKPELKGGGGGPGGDVTKRSVPTRPALSRCHLVHAQQHQLRGDWGSDSSADDFGFSSDHP